MSGEWSGGSANYRWQRAGHRGGPVDGDTERGARLFAELAGTPFWCDTCNGCHPLAEHAACRDVQTAEIIRHARESIAVRSVA